MSTKTEAEPGALAPDELRVIDDVARHLPEPLRRCFRKPGLVSEMCLKARRCHRAVAKEYRANREALRETRCLRWEKIHALDDGRRPSEVTLQTKRSSYGKSRSACAAIASTLPQSM
jgi:hypothetical protein